MQDPSSLHLAPYLAASVLLTTAALLGSACVPSSARQNAKLEDGFDLAIGGGIQYVGPGIDQDGNTTAIDKVVHGQIDLQYATVNQDGSGLALQVKVPLLIVFSSLDLYYELPDLGDNLYAGVGFELGLLAGPYGVITKYLDDNVYLSFTQRVERATDGGLLINPQFSLGLDSAVDISGFLSFAHYTGRGFDFAIDLFGVNNRTDYRKNFWLTGLTMRF